MSLSNLQGRRFYTPMIAHEQFNSISYMTQVNQVMATLESLGQVSHQKEDYAKGFEYVGPDIDADVRKDLFRGSRKLHKLRECTVGLGPRAKVDLELTP